MYLQYMENKGIIGNILTRTSVRIYENGVVIAPDEVEILLRAAMAAPSAVNKQPWQFVVVDDRRLLERLDEALPYAKMAAGASLAVVVCGDKSHFLNGGDDDLWVQDLSAATENLLLAAHAIGYGGVWTCVYPHADRMDPVRDILGLPEGIVPFNVVPIGKPAREEKPKDKWDETKVHRNGW